MDKTNIAFNRDRFRISDIGRRVTFIWNGCDGFNGTERIPHEGIITHVDESGDRHCDVTCRKMDDLTRLREENVAAREIITMEEYVL